jgi:multiple sugar transport system substrate-binding protein
MNLRPLMTVISVLAAVTILAISCGLIGGNNRLITFVYLSSQAQSVIYKDVISGFEKKYPPYKVKGIEVGRSAYPQKVYSMFSGGSVPDLFMAEDYYAYAGRDALLDLNEFIAQDSDFSWGNFFPQCKKAVKLGDKIFGLPYGVDTRVFYINKEKFRRAGLEIPYDGWSIAEFSKAIRAMTVIDQMNPNNTEYGFGFEPASDSLIPYLWSVGANLFDAKGRFVFNTPRIREVLKTFVAFRVKDQAMPPLESMLESGIVSPFFAGKIGMIYHGRYLMPELVTDAKIDWDVVPVPYIKEKAALMECKIFSIAKKAGNQEGAWKLLRYIVMEEGAQTLLKYGDIVPAVKSIAFSEDFLNWGEGDIHNGVFLKQLEYARLNPLLREKNAGKMQSRVSEKIWRMFMGQVDVDRGCREAEEEVRKAQKEKK